MPLTWDATKCDLDFDDENESVITQTTVFLCAAIGMGSITEKNWKEFYIRSAVVDRVKGPFMYKDGEPRSLKSSDIKRRIGLKTNVTFVTKATWRKSFMEGLELDERWGLNHSEDVLSDG